MSGTILVPALVLDATGDVAEGVVAALLATGRPVIAVARQQPALLALRQRLQASSGQLQLLAGHSDDEHAAAELAAAVGRLKRAPGAVIDLVAGLPSPGRLLDTPLDGLRARFDAEFVPHLTAARHLLPVLAAQERCTTYLVVSGPSADPPWAGYGCQSLAAATLHGLIRVLAEETRQTGVRVRQLAVDTPIRTDHNRQHASIDWPNSLEVGHRIAELLKQPPAQTVVHLERRGRPDPLSALRPIALARKSP